jgi:Glycosyl hydrolase family 115/Gylcosyl hydrolase family 115 C-terminal domain
MNFQSSVVEAGDAEDFRLAEKGSAAPLYVDASDFRVVHIAAKALASDIERVTGTKPTVATGAPQSTDYAVLIGTVGKSTLIDDLVAAKKLDVTGIQGAWESFVIATVPDPVPGVRTGLVIAGSDRRGTAYGVFTMSEAIGVSPWHWWADVPTRRRDALWVRSGVHRQGPPSVKYRGIFINDEDWGLLPWSAQTFEPESGAGMGPKTYAKVFGLLLRLKANYLWPAMHEVTKAFNLYPENKVVADEYAIVMGSSHCEPMLRTNTTEWPHDRHQDWNPVTNLPEILEYWEQRVRENGQYENIYTVGMRGIHDGGMPGGGTIDEKRERLEKVICLQRELLATHVNPDPSRVPQIFCPYKEVLDIYQSGMELPDDITMVWANDNHGYIRQLPNETERQRSGGHGIYYHLSYWGRPHDYLWLESTSPALVWHEMTKAYEFGVRQLWVVNVGDIKPTESGITLFLKLAWDIKHYGLDVQRTFLRDFYTQQFGEEYGEQIAALKDEYFRLCAIRRPEHMGFNRVYFSRDVPNNPVQNSDWSSDESQRILNRWLELARRAEALAGELPQESRDAYFQLVEYPACAGAAMAEKMIQAEKARLTGSDELAQQAEAALHCIEQLTKRYNTQNGGKWRGMMDHRPRELPVFDMPPTTPHEPQSSSAAAPRPQQDGQVVEIDPTKFSQTHDHDGAGWRVIEGLGPRGAAIAVLPRRDIPTLHSPQEIWERAPAAEYTVQTGRAGEVEVIVEALPTHRLTPAHEVLAAVSINDEEPVVVRFEQGKDDEDDPTWQTNVLRHAMFGQVTLRVLGGPYKLKLWAADAGVVVQRIMLRADEDDWERKAQGGNGQ